MQEDYKITSFGDYLIKAFSYAVVHFGFSLITNPFIGSEDSYTGMLVSSLLFGLFFPPMFELIMRWFRTRG